MNALAKIDAGRRVDPLQVFVLRCRARAQLMAEGELDPHEAVDALQDDAERNGLVAKLGQDEVQAMMARGFARYTTGIQDAPPRAHAETRATSPLQRARPTPQTTIEAVMFAVRKRGLAALHEPDTIARLARCDEAARQQINERIEKLGIGSQGQRGAAS